MKNQSLSERINTVFLSDLCGREEPFIYEIGSRLFLSDLHGREVFVLSDCNLCVFLSDLCGREGD
nr:hypothetical protein [Moraxella catarrhalis]